eukprot:CAMPEP_0176197394 /NCGR_PEP_ID=MMETSP0121_2-20121125/7518_1 /TAXON_ID=160619 /ORGANISM="Kryptoperidinium foliaceum, Strain CCMP 1326" /LENGTH=324 /DNA_ID=CAMNT_0017536219 /DNA_START=111 /DNA_END=1087 /DNA_ORIENTATION=-
MSKHVPGGATQRDNDQWLLKPWPRCKNSPRDNKREPAGPMLQQRAPMADPRFQRQLSLVASGLQSGKNCMVVLGNNHQHRHEVQHVHFSRPHCVVGSPHHVWNNTLEVFGEKPKTPAPDLVPKHNERHRPQTLQQPGSRVEAPAFGMLGLQAAQGVEEGLDPPFNRESDVVTVFSDSQVPCNLPIADVIDNIFVESTQNSSEPAVYWAYVFASEPNWTACPFALTGPPKRVKPRTDKEEPSLTASVTDKLSGKDAMPVVSATGRTVVEPQMSLLLLHVQLITDSPLPTGDKEYTFVPSDTRAMSGPMLLNRYLRTPADDWSMPK